MTDLLLAVMRFVGGLVSQPCKGESCYCWTWVSERSPNKVSCRSEQTPYWLKSALILKRDDLAAASAANCDADPFRAYHFPAGRSCSGSSFSLSVSKKTPRPSNRCECCDQPQSENNEAGTFEKLFRVLLRSFPCIFDQMLRRWPCRSSPFGPPRSLPINCPNDLETNDSLQTHTHSHLEFMHHLGLIRILSSIPFPPFPSLS